MFGGKAVEDLVKYANRVDGRNDRCRNGSSGGNDGAHSKGNRDGHRNSERGTARADYHRATGAERESEITTETITETTKEPQTTQEMPAETVNEEKPRKISGTVETPSESVTEPPKAELDVNYWIDFARSYALQIGLEIDPTAVECWDNPTTANADCIYLERDLTHRLDRYNRDDDITAVNIWAESHGNGNYLIYIAYA